ncbi:hypothetical protein F5X71_20075 [Nocardia brasiliensis]|uniref:Uncharacterized protein n=1 Tax=Nocardia brasiliensis TaxID=37326 RepID=A0A6G9XTN9_NOCBR|nr:hypothetical protein [Nocardia brasiliensis]QIS04322.1 hypothetical protein F5X71_20075 [Nocardia brasiliensis]
MRAEPTGKSEDSASGITVPCTGGKGTFTISQKGSDYIAEGAGSFPAQSGGVSVQKVVQQAQKILCGGAASPFSGIAEKLTITEDQEGKACVLTSSKAEGTESAPGGGTITVSGGKLTATIPLGGDEPVRVTGSDFGLTGDAVPILSSGGGLRGTGIIKGLTVSSCNEIPTGKFTVSDVSTTAELPSLPDVPGLGKPEVPGFGKPTG